MDGLPVAYQNGTTVLDWLNKGDNAWNMIDATIVGMQSILGLVILYGSIVNKKWAINSAFMALYAFAAVLICWVTWAYKMSFGDQVLPFWGKSRPALGQEFLIQQAKVPETIHDHKNGDLETPTREPFFPMATLVFFQFIFAAITLILLDGSLLGRMNIKAWMVFVLLWLTFSYTVGAFSIRGGGFLFQWGVINFSGGYVIHLSSGIAGFTAAYWVVPRSTKDREIFPPNIVLLMLAGAGLLWMGCSGFNGGGPYVANVVSSMAILNTNICAATNLLVWTCLDVIFFKKPSVIGVVQGMITGIVCITPGATLLNANPVSLHWWTCHHCQTKLEDQLMSSRCTQPQIQKENPFNLLINKAGGPTYKQQMHSTPKQDSDLNIVYEIDDNLHESPYVTANQKKAINTDGRSSSSSSDSGSDSGSSDTRSDSARSQSRSKSISRRKRKSRSPAESGSGSSSDSESEHSSGSSEEADVNITTDDDKSDNKANTMKDLSDSKLTPSHAKRDEFGESYKQQGMMEQKNNGKLEGNPNV